MKFFSERQFDKTIIGVILTDLELKQKESYLGNQFIFSVMNRISMMVAAYYFKKHKEEIIEMLNGEDIKHRIAVEIASKIRIEID